MSVLDANKVVLKLFLENESSADLEQYIPVFHRVIREKLVPGILIDVADYRHVHQGPGVMLIGHETDFAMDEAEGHVGLRFNRKRGDSGGLEQSLRSGLTELLSLARLLEQAPELDGAQAFSTSDLYFGVNDRLLAPNSPETFESCESVIRDIAVDLSGADTFELKHVEDPRAIFGARLGLSSSPSLDTLIGRLAD